MIPTTARSAFPSLLPAAMPAILRSVSSRMLGFDEIARMYSTLASQDASRPLWDLLLDHMNVTCQVADGDLELIPRAGPVVVVANHPFGLLEGAVLAVLLRRIRPDARFLANGLLESIPDLRDLVISVDPMSGRESVARNSRGLRRALEFVAGGGMLVVFPAGEVSHYQWRERRVEDSHWSPSIARFIKHAAARDGKLSVLPVFVNGSNSALFQASGFAHPRLRTALLVRELLNKKGRAVDLRIGKPIDSSTLLGLSSDRERIDYLRWRTYLLRNRLEFKPETRKPAIWKQWLNRTPEPLAADVPASSMAREIEALPSTQRLASSGDLECYIAAQNQIPNTLREIGRLREATFRRAGEGTGRSTDLDHFDSHYQHLFVWNASKHEVAGAYRLAETDSVRRRFGVNGLYTATLFRVGDPFLDALGPAVELGRSIVRPEYQKSFAPLLLLWKGIGQFVDRNPRCKVLFGPVSISNKYQRVSRDLMISFLEQRASVSALAGLVRARKPPRKATEKALCTSVEQLSDVVAELEPDRAGVPVLLRQYLRLGGKLLGFNVDSQFSDSLDGLILVDLTQTEPKLLERYLGRSEARRFLDYWKGQS